MGRYETYISKHPTQERNGKPLLKAFTIYGISPTVQVPQMASTGPFNALQLLDWNILITNAFLALYCQVYVINYRFIYVDVETFGRWSDGKTWEQYSLNAAISDKTLNIPKPTNLPSNVHYLHLFIQSFCQLLKQLLYM